MKKFKLSILACLLSLIFTLNPLFGMETTSSHNVTFQATGISNTPITVGPNGNVFIRTPANATGVRIQSTTSYSKTSNVPVLTQSDDGNDIFDDYFGTPQTPISHPFVSSVNPSSATPVMQPTAPIIGTQKTKKASAIPSKNKDIFIKVSLAVVLIGAVFSGYKSFTYYINSSFFKIIKKEFENNFKLALKKYMNYLSEEDLEKYRNLDKKDYNDKEVIKEVSGLVSKAMPISQKIKRVF